MRTFSQVLLCFGFICLIFAGFLYWQRTTPARLKFNIKNVGSGSSQNSIKIQPKVLIIRDLGIELDIYPETINNGKWNATDKGVSYLSSTVVPGEIGNSVIYGHNWKNLLGNLVKVKPGQIVEIIYSNGSLKKFEVKYTQVVTSDQIQILNQSKDRRITLYTCTGFLDIKRFVVTAVLKNQI